MKRKTFKWMSLLLAVLLVLPCCLSGSATQQDTVSYALASWPYLAETFQELLSASDVVLIGTVMSQRPDVRHDLVFTYSTIRVKQVLQGELGNNAAAIDVLQTGGTANGITTPAIYDAPLMKRGESYLLCLTYSPADGTYPAYYLPTGGGQGTIAFAEMASAEPVISDTPISNAQASLRSLYSLAESVFNSHNYGCCQPMSGSYGDDPLLYGYWEVSTLDYGIYGDGLQEFIGYTDSAMYEWNDNDYITIIKNQSSVSPKIGIYTGNYGTIWEAITMYSIGGGFGDGSDYYNGLYKYVKIDANLSFYNQNNSIWVEIMGHEGGHALGLGHTNPYDRPESIMVGSTSDRTATVPSAYDINLVNSKYESIP